METSDRIAAVRSRSDGDAETLSRESCELIRLGAIDLNDANLRAHLRQSLADVLAINNPEWLNR